jgi:hypothetical protein
LHKAGTAFQAPRGVAPALKNVPYRRIAEMLGYKTEGGAWRAIKIEEKRNLAIAVTVFDKSL